MSESKNQLQISQILPNGDRALLLRFNTFEGHLLHIHSLATDLMHAPLPAQINVVPATDSLVLVFSQVVNHSLDWWGLMQQRIINNRIQKVSPQVHRVPICYDPEVAPDLAAVCTDLSISIEQLIQRHSQASYQVAMLGFLPGFAYLNGNDKSLDLPRKSTPELSLPAGSVAIAGRQTGIYSLSSPGGWHVIGRTPLKLLDWHNSQQPMLFAPLDEVQFEPIGINQYHQRLYHHEP